MGHTSILVDEVYEDVHGAGLGEGVIFPEQPQNLLTSLLNSLALYLYRWTIVTTIAQQRLTTLRLQVPR